MRHRDHGYSSERTMPLLAKELEKWNAFGEFPFGTPPGCDAAGHTHYGYNSSTGVSINPDAANNPLLHGVATNFHVRSWLYRVTPDFPPANATRLLIGNAVNPDKPAVANPVTWTWTNYFGGRALFTTMGHPEDFSVEPFQRVIVNGIHWALGKPSPFPGNFRKWKSTFPTTSRKSKMLSTADG